MIYNNEYQKGRLLRILRDPRAEVTSPEEFYLLEMVNKVPGMYTMGTETLVDMFTNRGFGGLSSADLIEDGWWGDGVADFISACINEGFVTRLPEKGTLLDQAEYYLQFGVEVDEWGLPLNS